MELDVSICYSSKKKNIPQDEEGKVKVSAAEEKERRKRAEAAERLADKTF